MSSDPVHLGVNAPFSMVYQFSTYNNWPYSDGYETRIFYKTYPHCGDAFRSIVRNEQFPGGWQGLQANNWAKPSAGGSAGYAGTGGIWFDQARMTTVACTFQPCLPVPRNYNGTLSADAVDQALQTWYFGNTNWVANPTGGVFVQSGLAVRYVDLLHISKRGGHYHDEDNFLICIRDSSCRSWTGHTGEPRHAGESGLRRSPELTHPCSPKVTQAF